MVKKYKKLWITVGYLIFSIVVIIILYYCINVLVRLVPLTLNKFEYFQNSQTSMTGLEFSMTSVHTVQLLQGPGYSLNFKTIYINNKILGTFLESGNYNNIDFSENKNIFSNFITNIVDKINTNYIALMEYYPLFYIIDAVDFVGYCEKYETGSCNKFEFDIMSADDYCDKIMENKYIFTLRKDIEDIKNYANDYVILSDYITNTDSCGHGEFYTTNGFNIDTQFLAVNKKYIEQVIPEYTMKCNAINVNASSKNIAVKMSIVGPFDITRANFIGLSFADWMQYDEGNKNVYNKYHTTPQTPIYKLNQLFYNIVQTNYITTVPTDNFNNLDKYVYIVINTQQPLYLTYDTSKVDTTQTVLDCLSVDQTLPRLKVLPMESILPNNTRGISYIVHSVVNSNIFAGPFMLGIETLNIINTPLKLYKQYEILPNVNKITESGGIHNIGYPFFIFNKDNFSISDYVIQSLKSSFGITNNKITHLTADNTFNTITTKLVFDDIKYKYSGYGFGYNIYVGTYTYVNNILNITSMVMDSANKNVILLLWHYTGLQISIPVLLADTNIKIIIIDSMQFIINSASKAIIDNKDVIYCVIKLFEPIIGSFLSSSENLQITTPLTTKVSNINTPTIYQPEVKDFLFDFAEYDMPPIISTSTTMSPVTSTTMPPVTSTTMPPITSTTMPPITSTTTNYITSAKYDEIIQKYRGNVKYPLRIPTMQNNKYINNTQTQTTKPIQFVSDDIINYYGNLIVDKEGINSLIQNKYIDDLLK